MTDIGMIFMRSRSVGRVIVSCLIHRTRQNNRYFYPSMGYNNPPCDIAPLGSLFKREATSHPVTAQDPIRSLGI